MDGITPCRTVPCGIQKARILVAMLRSLLLNSFLLHIWYTLPAFSILTVTSLSSILARVVYLTIQVWEQLPLKGNRLHVLCQIAVPHHQLAGSWSCSHALMRILLWVHASSKMSSMCCSSLLVSATSAKSSAYNTSCVQAVDGVLSWYVRKSPPPMV